MTVEPNAVSRLLTTACERAISQTADDDGTRAVQSSVTQPIPATSASQGYQQQANSEKRSTSDSTHDRPDLLRRSSQQREKGQPFSTLPN